MATYKEKDADRVVILKSLDAGVTWVPDETGGGSGGGGHTIRDAGVDETQRAALNFTDGFVVTDDAGNDETEVAADTAYFGGLYSALGHAHSHGSLTGVGANDHHNQAHAIDGADHTASGLTSGHVLRATGATTYAFGAIQTGDVPTLDHGSKLSGLGDDDHTQYALLLGRSGGQTLYGGTASGNSLVLHSTSHATDGTIDLESPVEVLPTSATYGAAFTGIDFPAAYTLDFTNATVAGFLKFSGAVVLDDVGNGFNMGQLFAASGTLRNKNGEANNMGPFIAYLCNLSIRADGATISQSAQYDFLAQDTFEVANGGTFTCADYTQFRAAPFSVTTGATVTIRYGLRVVDAGTVTGTITEQVGVQVDKLSDATTNCGIKNASTTVFTPTARAQITAVGNQIDVSALRSTVVTLTSNGAHTLTSTPTVTDGQYDGQILILRFNGGTNSVTLQSHTALANTNLRLSGGGTRQLNQYDTLTLMWDGTNSEWVEIAYSQNS